MGAADRYIGVPDTSAIPRAAIGLMSLYIPSHWRQLKYSTYPRRFSSGAPSAVRP